jgi:hypothetical protein
MSLKHREKLQLEDEREQLQQLLHIKERLKKLFMRRDLTKKTINNRSVINRSSSTPFDPRE